MVIPVIRNESGNESDRLFLLSFLSTETETKVALRAGTDRKLRMILIEWQYLYSGCQIFQS
ncbi:hypothetical protein HMPREF0083_01191 [Aneurinibacillus aneurinilyticus ATCC 12856]|uniref:Uncharacterized protein n=1 Tax=Aneurinibacillus aneurinilyticus ATCC 12856 TaxID=649747 RepID=U1YF48_ANEAE|nr:hypothetical protein HMPREF0083_01191 [Aneurinibacillus aneurinilyticus ATCC 12856]